MPASTNRTPSGRRTRRPGVYSKVDASGAGLASGDGIVRVAIIGEAEGGVPVSVVTDGVPAFERFASYEAAEEVFRAGPLRDAVYHAFTASADDRVGRPIEVLTFKVNPATRGTAVLPNGEGDAVRLFSRTYGEVANRVATRLDPGTEGGLRARVTFDGSRVEGDNIGAAPALAFAYNGEATVDLVVDPGAGLSFPFAVDVAADPVDEAHGSSAAAVVTSSAASDTWQRVTVYGVDGVAPVAHTVSLAGTGDVPTPEEVSAVTGVRVNGLTAGAITVGNPGGDDAFVIPATLTNPWPAGQSAVLVSSSALDVGQRVTLVVRDAVGQRVTRSATLNGTTEVPVAFAIEALAEVHVDGPAVGTITVSAANATVALTLAPGVTDAAGATAGLFAPKALPVDGTLTLSLGGAPVGTPFVVVRGVSKAGARLAVRVLVTAVAAAVTGTFAQLEHIELGMLEAASTLTVSGIAYAAPATATWRDLADKVGGLTGFDATLLRVSDGALTVADLDAANLADIGAGEGVSLAAVLYDLVAWFNADSQYVTAEMVEGATAPPSLTPAPVYLTGGGEGVTTLADWRAAFDALRLHRDVVLVPLSTDPAVHAQLRAHTRYMAEDRIGTDERNGYVPLALTLNRAQLGAAILELDDANVSACAQRVWRRDALGELRAYGPEALAVMLAAMQAGSTPPGSQTHKALDIVRFDQNADWRPDDHAEELIERGLMFVRRDENRVIVERAVTTYRGDNRVYTEITPNLAAQLLVKGARALFKRSIGDPNYGPGASSARSLLNAYLQTKVGTLLVAFDPQRTQVRDLGDALDASFYGRVVETLNFVNLTFRASAGGSQ